MFFGVRPPPKTEPPPRVSNRIPKMPCVQALEPTIVELRRAVDHLFVVWSNTEVDECLSTIDHFMKIIKKRNDQTL